MRSALSASVVMAAMWKAERILDSKPTEHAIVLMMAASTAERLDVGSSVAAGAAAAREWRTAAAILDLRPRFARIGLAAAVGRFVAAAESLTARPGSGCHHTAAVEAAAVGATTAAGSVVIR